MSYSIITNEQNAAIPANESPLGTFLLVTSESNVDLPAGSLLENVVSSSDWSLLPQAIQNFLDYVSPRAGGYMRFHIVVQNVAEDPTEAVDRVKDGLLFQGVVYLDSDVFTVANIELMDSLGLAMAAANRPVCQCLQLPLLSQEKSTVALTFKRVAVLSFTGNTTSGSLTVSNIADTSAIVVGQEVEGAGIPSGTLVNGKTSNTITLDTQATATGTDVALKVYGVDSEITIKAGRAFKRVALSARTGSATLGSAVISSISSMTGIEAGQEIQGAGIPAGSKVISIDTDNSALTMNKVATATNAGIALTLTTDKLYFAFPAGSIGLGDLSTELTGTAIETGTKYNAVAQDTITELETSIAGVTVNNAAASSSASSQSWDEYRVAVDSDGRWDKWIFGGEVVVNVGLNHFAHYVALKFKYHKQPQYPPGYGLATPIAGMPGVQTYYKEYLPKAASVFLRGTGDGIGKRIIDAYYHDGSIEARLYPGSQMFTQSTDQFKRPEHFLLYQTLWYQLLNQIQGWADNPRVRLATVAGLDTARLELLARIQAALSIGDITGANLYKFDPVVIYGANKSSNGALYPELEGVQSTPGRFQVVMNFWPTPTASRFTVVNTLKTTYEAEASESAE